MSFSRCDWLFPPSAREVSPGNRSNYKSTRERVDSKGLYGRWRLHLIGSWLYLLSAAISFEKKHATLLKIYYFFILCSFFVQHSNSHLFLRYVRLENIYEFIGKLRICSCLACVYRVVDARGKFGEHERCVRVARGDSRVQL